MGGRGNEHLKYSWALVCVMKIDGQVEQKDLINPLSGVVV